MGNKELKFFYIDKGIVNAKKERILGITLITVSIIFLVYIIFIILLFVVPYGIALFSLSFATEIFPTLIIFLIMLFYGIYSLIRAKIKNKSKLK